MSINDVIPFQEYVTRRISHTVYYDDIDTNK